MTTEIIHADPSNVLPAFSLDEVVKGYNDVVHYVRTVLVENTDYGVIPGVNSKPTLYKPGAEKLCKLFNFRVTFTLVDKLVDFERGLFHFHYKAHLWRGPLVAAEGEGSCNSYEVKYRYRKSERVCPECGKATIIKGKAEYGGGWLCFAKKGGCGAKFTDGDPAIEQQQVGQVENPDKADLVNTLTKMAQKRALVAAALIGCAVSDFFSQDLEDISLPGQQHATYEDVERISAIHTLKTMRDVERTCGITPPELSSSVVKLMTLAELNNAIAESQQRIVARTQVGEPTFP